MPGVPDTESLLLGLVVGLVVGGVVGGGLLTSAHTPSPDNSNPAWGYSSGGPSCYDEPTENAGWLHVAATGERWTVTLNATVVHPRGTEVDVDVTRRPTGDYEIALTTGEASRREPLSEDSCQVATTIDVATGLTEPEFSVTANGRTIRSIDQQETVANLYSLQNPINATVDPPGN